MKKIVLKLLVVLCGLLTAIPAFAVDFDYGGYFRTRAYSMDGFSGDGDDKSQDLSQVDARGRLWTVHTINSSMSWTNRVEFNVIWGDEENGGGIGTDATDNLRFKHSFIDLDTPILDENIHWRIGLQRLEQSKGFLFCDDFAGLNVSFDALSGEFNLIWMKVYEGSVFSDDYDDDLDDLDVDFIGLTSKFNMLNDALTLKPYVFYLTSKDGSEFSGTTGNSDMDVFYIGADIEYAFSSGKVWAVLIDQFGSAGVVYDDDVDYDVSGYLGAVGGEVKFGKLGIHGEVFYSSGDDEVENDDVTCFYIPKGQQHYWSEIMGAGVFDSYVSNGSPGYEVSTTTAGLMAYNLGLSFDFSDDLTVTGDIWYGQYAETNETFTEDSLGTEVDLRVDYMVNEDLTLTVVGAYLFADDATNLDAEDATDVFEMGLQLSFFFKSF